eukprot:sb/3467316/
MACLSLVVLAHTIGSLLAITVWNPVELGERYSCNLVGLQITTNISLGSSHKIVVGAISGDGDQIASIRIAAYTTNWNYHIGQCMEAFTPLPVQPSSETDQKVWNLTKTDTTLIISCNGVELLEYDFTSSSDCAVWRGDVVEAIKFSSNFDTASKTFTCGDTPFGCSCGIFTSVGLHPEKKLTKLAHETSYLDYSIPSFKVPGVSEALLPLEVCFWHQKYQKEFFAVAETSKYPKNILAKSQHQQKIPSGNFDAKNTLPGVVELRKHQEPWMRVQNSPSMKFHNLVLSTFFWVKPNACKDPT